MYITGIFLANMCHHLEKSIKDKRITPLSTQLFKSAHYNTNNNLNLLIMELVKSARIYYSVKNIFNLVHDNIFLLFLE